MNSGALLDEIAATLQKKCISDLRWVSQKELAKSVLFVDVNKYSLDEWSYALSYIKGTKIKLTELKDISCVLRDM